MGESKRGLGSGSDGDDWRKDLSGKKNRVRPESGSRPEAGEVEGRWRAVESGGGPREGRDGVARERGASAGPDIRHTPQVLTVPAGGVSLYPDPTFDVLFSFHKKQVTIFTVQYMEEVRQKKSKVWVCWWDRCACRCRRARIFRQTITAAASCRPPASPTSAHVENF